MGTGTLYLQGCTKFYAREVITKVLGNLTLFCIVYMLSTFQWNLLPSCSGKQHWYITTKLHVATSCKTAVLTPSAVGTQVPAWVHRLWTRYDVITRSVENARELSSDVWKHVIGYVMLTDNGNGTTSEGTCRKTKVVWLRNHIVRWKVGIGIVRMGRRNRRKRWEDKKRRHSSSVCYWQHVWWRTRGFTANTIATSLSARWVDKRVIWEF